MSTNVTITAKGLDDAIAAVVGKFDAKKRAGANKVGARAAQQSLKKYHRSKGRKLWIVPGPTHGPGRTNTGWYKQVAAAWATGAISENGAQVINGAQFFAHKVTGGTIKAKRVRFLTIPLIPEAHGKTAKQFEQEEGTPLFRIGRALFMSNARPGTDKVTAVYALKRSVKQAPTKGALPVNDVFMDPFTKAMADYLLS